MTDDGARQPVSGATRLAAVIGDPVRHSLSPTLHNAGFAALGLDWIYVALPVSVDDGPEAVHAARLLGIDGLSVTMPHKQAVAETVDAGLMSAILVPSMSTSTSQDSLGRMTVAFWINDFILDF